MILYHASKEVVQHPDTVHSRKYLDFGPGFYLTSIREQAERYAERFKRMHKDAWLNTYELKAEWQKWHILRFEKYDEPWLDFIVASRKGEVVGDWDVIIGGIADDRVFRTLDYYFAGDISKVEALRRLTFEKPNIQYCIRSQQMIDQCLIFKDSRQI